MSEPIHIISLGAGVQSSTMALMASHGEITPMPKCAIFADTQDEPQSVYRWLDWLEKQLPFPVYRETKGSLSKESYRLRRSSKSGKLYNRAMVPAFVMAADGKKGILGRKCTIEYKIEVLIKAAKKLALIPRACKEIRVIQWIGISLDEIHRMKPARAKWIQHLYPLIDKRISRHDCLLWMESHGYPKPPRSACVYCPYHSDTEWRRLRDQEPTEFAKAVDFERKLQATIAKDEVLNGIVYLHDSCVPLDQVDFSTDEDHGQQVMFGNECEGMCGV